MTRPRTETHIHNRSQGEPSSALADVLVIIHSPISLLLQASCSIDHHCLTAIGSGAHAGSLIAEAIFFGLAARQTKVVRRSLYSTRGCSQILMQDRAHDRKPRPGKTSTLHRDLQLYPGWAQAYRVTEFAAIFHIEYGHLVCSRKGGPEARHAKCGRHGIHEVQRPPQWRSRFFRLQHLQRVSIPQSSSAHCRPTRQEYQTVRCLTCDLIGVTHSKCRINGSHMQAG